MSVVLRIATQADLVRVLAMVQQCHEEVALVVDDIESAILPLLEGTPAAVLYLIGPPMAPVGYSLVSFGYDFTAGGPTATLAELFIRPAIRGRGVGSEAVLALAQGLSAHGIRALSIKSDVANPRAKVFCRRLGFVPEDSHIRMIRAL